MKIRPFMLQGIIVLLAATHFSQIPNQLSPVAVRVLSGGDISDFERPRIVDEKAAAVGASVVVNTVDVELQAFERLNRLRAEKGAGPLTWNSEVAAVARLHSQNMAEFQFFSHRGLDNKLVSDRADANHLGKWRSIGENIAFNRGFADPIEKALQQWLDSPSHRLNLLNPSWKESAVGVAVAADGAYYFTHVFLRK